MVAVSVGGEHLSAICIIADTRAGATKKVDSSRLLNNLVYDEAGG